MVVAAVAADRDPGDSVEPRPTALVYFSVVSLEVIPTGQTDLCGDLDGVNDPDDLENLALEEQRVLRLIMLASDPDGDPLIILAPTLSATVDSFGYTISGDTLTLAIALGEGAVTVENCERLGDLVLSVREDVAGGQTYNDTLGFYGMWEGPDLAVTLSNVQPSYPLGSVAGIWGQVVVVAGQQFLSPADDYRVTIQIETPWGLNVANSANFSGGDVPYRIEAPRYTFTEPGQYTARITLFGRDLNPDNNELSESFSVQSGPLRVIPNVATPNGDGANDEILFRLENQAVTRPSVKIFTLEGKLIFETDEPRGSRLVWDGRDNQGRLVPPGSYLYVLYDEGRTIGRGTCGVVR
jgi:hypothetical protein